MKKLLYFFPELVLILLSIYWFLDGFIAAKNVNYISLFLILLLLFQLIYRNKIVGYVLAFFILILALYMPFAVLSEFHEFKKFSSEVIKFLAFGLTMCLLLLVSSLLMFYNYSKQK